MARIIRAIRRTIPLACAMAFGRYVVSGWDGRGDYHEYEWRGVRYRYSLPEYR